MTTRAEIRRTDNSRLGRAVLNNKHRETKEVSVAPAPVVKKSSIEKKTTKKS